MGVWRWLFLGEEHTEQQAEQAQRRHERRQDKAELAAGGARRALRIEGSKHVGQSFKGYSAQQMVDLEKAAERERK